MSKLIKINLAELAQVVLDRHTFNIKQDGITVDDADLKMEDYHETIDEFLVDVTPEGYIIDQNEYETIEQELQPILIMEVMKRCFDMIKHFDPEDKKLIEDPIQEYLVLEDEE